jgi:tetratricopeptide (TPR) repeat protein
MARGELDRAVMEAQRAISEGGDSIEPLVVLGELMLRQGLSGEALERFGQALGSGPLDPEAVRGPNGQHVRSALLGRARALLDLDRIPDARSEAERLVGLVPEDVGAQRALAEAYVRSGDPRLAVGVLQRAREADPTNVALLTELGLACAAAGEMKTAEESLRRAVHLDDGAVAALTALARVLSDTGRATEGREHLRTALSLLPSYGEAGMALAELEWGAGRRHEAIVVLVDLLTADPYLLSALTRLGHALEEVGKREEAIVAYTRVLRFQSGDAEAAAGLARLQNTPVQA